MILKQVRDQIHSRDVVSLFLEFYKNPKCGEVYNLGGGRKNSISIIESIAKIEKKLKKKIKTKYIDKNRKGDHICYISNLNKIRSHFPNWSITYSVDDIIDEIIRKLK